MTETAYRTCKKCGKKFLGTWESNCPSCRKNKRPKMKKSFNCLWCGKKLEILNASFCDLFCERYFYDLRTKLCLKFSNPQLVIELDKLKKEGKDYKFEEVEQDERC